MCLAGGEKSPSTNALRVLRDVFSERQLDFSAQNGHAIRWKLLGQFKAIFAKSFDELAEVGHGSSGQVMEHDKAPGT